MLDHGITKHQILAIRTPPLQLTFFSQVKNVLVVVHCPTSTVLSNQASLAELNKSAQFTAKTSVSHLLYCDISSFFQNDSTTACTADSALISCSQAVYTETTPLLHATISMPTFSAKNVVSVFVSWCGANLQLQPTTSAMGLIGGQQPSSGLHCRPRNFCHRQ